MMQMFSIGERSGLQAGQFSTNNFTMKPCCCNSCSMWFCIDMLRYTSSGGEHMKSSFPKRYKSILIVFMKMTFFYLDPYILLIFNLSC